MHMRYRTLRIPRRRKQDIRRAAISRKLAIHRHIEIGNGAVDAEDLV